MNERETSTSPPDTLIGLGPPDPPEKYGADPTDAPETLRAWSTSRKAAVEEEAPVDEPFLPLEPLFPGRIWPISAADEGPLEVPAFRRPAARSLVFWAAPALLTAVAIVSATVFSRERSRPETAAPSVATHAATTRVVGGSWVLRQDVPGEQPQEESPKPARIFFREPSEPSRPTHARLAPPTNVRVAPPVVGLAQVEEQTTEITSDSARVQAVADAVRLEDDGAEPSAPVAVEHSASEAKEQ